MTVQITVIGLGQIGASIGLALSDKTDQLLRVGNDRSIDAERQAEKMGAFDKIKRNLHAAVEDADIVVLALPVDEIHETLKMIVEDLKEGAVVLDTSPVKVAVSGWAKELLPAGRFFLTFCPSLNPQYLEEAALGIDAAHPDLFQRSLIAITSPPGTDPDAVKLASDLALLLGAQPFFVDPHEADGLLAASHLLPKLVAAAMVNATIDQPGWTEGRKLAGQAYAGVTAPVAHLDEVKSLGMSALLNQENVLRVMDDLVTELVNLRTSIANRDEEALSKLLEYAQKGREEWLLQRFKMDWGGEMPQANLPTAGEMMGRLFSFGLLRKSKPKDGK